MPELSGILGGNLTYLAAALVFLVAVLVATLLAAIFVVGPRSRLKRRMAGLGLTGGGNVGPVAKGGPPRQRRVQEKLQELDAEGKRKARRRRLRTDLLQAGLDVSLAHYFIVLAIVGLLIGAVYLLLGYPVLGALPAGIIGAFALPKIALKTIAAKRQKRFTKDFSGALDIVVRGVRTGLPIGECLNIVASEMKDPVGTEFRLLVEGQKLGLTLEELMRRGLERMPTPEFSFFAIVLQVQLQTGGSLAETLGNLSNVLRDRKKMKDKVQAMSSEAKSSAAIIGSLPLLVGGAMSLMKPDYMSPFFDTDLGPWLFGGGCAWMLTGVLVMKKMINFKI